MRHAQHSLRPRREPVGRRVAANFPAVYLQERRRARACIPAPIVTVGPLDIPGARLWLKAEDLALSDDDPVATWPDACGLGNDVSQATLMKQPTFKTVLLNFLPVVRFDGIDDTLFKTAAAGFASATGQTICAVLNPNPVGYGMAVVTRATMNELRLDGGGTLAQWMAPNGTYTVESDADVSEQWKVWIATYHAATGLLELFINGESQGTNTDVHPLAVTDIYLGSRTDSYNWSGDMAELVVYDAALGGADVLALSNYYATKFALT